MKTTKKPIRKKQPPAPLKIYSMNLAPDGAAVLAALAQEASDQIGRRISTSAVLRAILRCVAQGMLPAPAITATIVEELAGGRKWGKTSRAS